MRLFETIKETVTVGQAAEYYGMKIGRNNMICCPFHNDHYPSMKLNTTYYYCFGCGATGDVIQFVANLFGLSNYEAAKKIAVDFGITPDNPPVIAALKKPEYMETKSRQKELHECQKMVCEYLHRLEKWKALYAPERPDLPMDERFEEACENLSYIEYLADYLTFADEEEGFEVVKSIGYCLIPSNKGQRMMIIKGNGGEGKSQIGAVLNSLLGSNMKDGSIGKISENRFARADLEHILLCVDDDMRMEALKQTSYVKSIVTAQGKMDLERKGKQSYQGWLFSRLLAFSNGDLQALYDRSDGFYRRQLVLTAKEKPADRVDDPYLAEKMKKEAESIFLWAFKGLQRLVRQNFKFTESPRIKANRENVKRDNNNVLEFLESEGYIRFQAEASASSKELYESYRLWCEENSMTALKNCSFSDAMIAVQAKYNLEHCNTIKNSAGRRVWGFTGVKVITKPSYTDGFMDDSQCTYVPKEWTN